MLFLYLFQEWRVNMDEIRCPDLRGRNKLDSSLKLQRGN